MVMRRDGGDKAALGQGDTKKGYRIGERKRGEEQKKGKESIEDKGLKRR